MTKAQFGKAYDATSKRRGGGLRASDDALVRAFAAFKRSGEFAALCAVLGVDAQTGNQELGRMLRREAAQSSHGAR